MLNKKRYIGGKETLNKHWSIGSTVVIQKNIPFEVSQRVYGP
jgi:hypothetical protein